MERKTLKLVISKLLKTQIDSYNSKVTICSDAFIHQQLIVNAGKLRSIITNTNQMFYNKK